MSQLKGQCNCIVYLAQNYGLDPFVPVRHGGVKSDFQPPQPNSPSHAIAWIRRGMADPSQLLEEFDSILVALPDTHPTVLLLTWRKALTDEGFVEVDSTRVSLALEQAFGKGYSKMSLQLFLSQADPKNLC
jgi:hypothetical protein